MKKSVIALAAMAVVGGASAQVVISGYFGASVDSIGISTPNAARTGNTSETRVTDHSSRIIFGVAEDLGGGLEAIGQFDLRLKMDQAARLSTESSTTAGASVGPAYATANPLDGGNNHVGLRSKTMGTVRLGRQDIYYVENVSYLPAGMFTAANAQPVLHSLATANASRTPNLVWYESPRMSDIAVTVGYSTQPLRTSGTIEVENDMSAATKTRAGDGKYLKFNYNNGPIDASYAYVDLKSDYTKAALYATTTGSNGGEYNANADQKGTTLSLKYDAGMGLKVGYARSTESQNAVATSAAVTTATAFAGLVPALVVGSKTAATANSFSASYAMGANNFNWMTSKRSNLTYDGVEQANTSLTQTTLAYHYDLSKRTAVGVMYTELKNSTNTATNLFYQSNNAFGGNITSMLGEKYKITSVNLRHSF